MGAKNRARLAVAYPVSVMAVFFVVPFCIMFAVSFFQKTAGGYFVATLDLSNYARFISPFFGRILLTSLGFSAAAALIATFVAVPFTYFICQMTRRWQTAILLFLLSTLSLSEVIIGFAWSTLLSQTAGVGNLFAALGLTESPLAYTPGFMALLLGLTYLGFPYAVLVVYPAISRLDPELTDAARMLGASPVLSFLNVVLPILKNTIIGALILVFVFTLGAYLLPQVLGRPQHWTLSVHITDQAIFQSNIPFAAAMAIFLLLVSLFLVGITMLLSREAGSRS